MKQTFGPYQGMTMEHFLTLNESQSQAVKVVTQYLQELEDNRARGRGLTFLGPNGVGKTMLASIVLNGAYEHGYRIETIELSSYVMLFKDQFTLRDMIKKSDDEDLMDEYIRSRRHLHYIQGRMKHSADWVLFDDIGREYPSESGWSQNQFFDTMRFRWNRRLPTIVTSNLPKEHLEDRYSEGMTSLLMESSEIVVLEGDDYRAKGLPGHRD